MLIFLGTLLSLLLLVVALLAAAYPESCGPLTAARSRRLGRARTTSVTSAVCKQRRWLRSAVRSGC